MKSKVLVFLQFFIILIMTLPFGTPMQNPVVGLFFIIGGSFIALLALAQNNLQNFNIRPDIKENAVLITTGIYSYIRHPMYSAVLTIMFGVVLLYPIKLLFISYIALICVLMLKLFYEESLWKAQDENYLQYMQNSRRLIPFLF